MAAQTWKKFDSSAVAKANGPGRIFVIRRPNGKVNAGVIESMNAEGVWLSNGSWTVAITFNDGPAKMFMAFDPPAVDIVVADKQLI